MFAEWRSGVQLLTCHVWDAVLIILWLHNKWPQNFWTVLTNIYYLTVSVRQELRSSLSGWFRLKVSGEAAVKMLAEAASSEGLTGAEGSTPKTGPSYGCWQETSFPHHMGLSVGLSDNPHTRAAGFSQSEWLKRVRQSLSQMSQLAVASSCNQKGHIPTLYIHTERESLGNHTQVIPIIFC